MSSPANTQACPPFHDHHDAMEMSVADIPCRVAEAKPIELLRDRRGIYGIGVSDEYDHEARAWICGVEEDRFGPRGGHTPRSLILRPDYFEHTEPQGAALQKIVGGFRRGIFCHSAEERLRQFVHHEALGRAGLPWPPTDHRERWWSTTRRSKHVIGKSITGYACSRYA